MKNKKLSETNKRKRPPKKEKKMGGPWSPVDDARAFKVTVFDDGNEGYAAYENRWRIVARWRGKVSLRNASVGAVIGSISEWKVEPCE